MTRLQHLLSDLQLEQIFGLIGYQAVFLICFPLQTLLHQYTLTWEGKS